MKYASGAAFRMALEDRLRAESRSTGLPLSRLRKTVAFDRLLARMAASSPDGWLLKGGFALQLQLDNQARATKDIDLLLLAIDVSSHAMLLAAARTRLGDWFEFEVGEPSHLPMHGGARMSVRALLDGRSFETFHVDVGLDDPVTGPPDRLPVTPLLAFADLEPTIVPCYPLVQHVAEKLHALTRSRGTRDNSRVKDLVDLVLLAEQQPFEAASLQAAIRATFGSRASDAVPEQLPEPPAWWGVEFRRMGRDVGLVAETLDAAMELLDAFLTPVLCGDARGEWLSAERRWSE
jgi:hypothetical protein